MREKVQEGYIIIPGMLVFEVDILDEGVVAANDVEGEDVLAATLRNQELQVVERVNALRRREGQLYGSSHPQEFRVSQRAPLPVAQAHSEKASTLPFPVRTRKDYRILKGVDLGPSVLRIVLRGDHGCHERLELPR